MDKFLCLFIFSFSVSILSHPDSSIKKYPNEMAHIPTPLPDRVVLTWNDNPATTQAVSW